MKHKLFSVTRLSVSFLLLVSLGCSENTIVPSASDELRNARIATVSSSSYQVKTIYQDMIASCIAQGNDITGSEGVYAEASATDAFAQMAQGYDVSTATATRITDREGNTWQKYNTTSASTVKEFAAKGITIKASIDWGTVVNMNPGPSRKKLRFTQE